jgi:hypothetical protein
MQVAQLKARLLPPNTSRPTQYHKQTQRCSFRRHPNKNHSLCIVNKSNKKSHTCIYAACEYGQSLTRQRRRCKLTSTLAESSSAPTSTAPIENIHSVATTTSCANASASGSMQVAAQSAPPPSQHIPPNPISQTNTTLQLQTSSKQKPEFAHH